MNKSLSFRNKAGASGAAIMIVLVLLFALGQFHRASGGVLASFLRESFSLDASNIGTAISMMFLGMVLFQLPLGVVLDRFGVVLVLPASLIIVAVATLYFSYAGTKEDIILSRFVMGAGLAIHGAATHVLISHFVSNSRFGLANGLITAFGGIGGLAGTYPLASAMVHFGWRPIFSILAVSTFVLAVVVFFILAKARNINKEKTKVQNQAETVSAKSLSLFSNWEFMKILVLGFVAYAPITTITGLWAGPFYSSVFSLDAEFVGGLIAIMFGATILASFVFGGLDAIIKARRKFVVAAACLSGLSLFGAAVMPYRSILPVTACLLLMVFVQQFYIPLLAHLQKVVPANMLGRASAIFSLVSVFGISAMQTVFGIVLDNLIGLGFEVVTAYRICFALMGGLIFLLVLIYASGKGTGK